MSPAEVYKLVAMERETDLITSEVALRHVGIAICDALVAANCRGVGHRGSTSGAFKARATIRFKLPHARWWNRSQTVHVEVNHDDDDDNALAVRLKAYGVNYVARMSRESSVNRDAVFDAGIKMILRTVAMMIVKAK